MSPEYAFEVFNSKEEAILVFLFRLRLALIDTVYDFNVACGVARENDPVMEEWHRHGEARWCTAHDKIATIQQVKGGTYQWMPYCDYFLRNECEMEFRISPETGET